MEKIHCHNNNFEEKLKEVSSWNITHKQAKKIQQFFNDYSIGKITGKRGSSPEGNLLRNLYFLKVGLENLKSETLKGVEQFLEDLLKDKIKAYNQQTKKYLSQLLRLHYSHHHHPFFRLQYQNQTYYLL